ncbi:hypothetical protein HanPSC8_Chr08g0319591 [Helianthus annuus]|nr:hypothetical protein HanPSC8_Chr08g0319591 [Helianthus annuus]
MDLTHVIRVALRTVQVTRFIMTGICWSSILPLFHPTTENTQPHLLRFLLLSAHFACSMNVFTYSSV